MTRLETCYPPSNPILAFIPTLWLHLGFGRFENIYSARHPELVHFTNGSNIFPLFRKVESWGDKVRQDLSSGLQLPRTSQSDHGSGAMGVLFPTTKNGTGPVVSSTPRDMVM